MKGGRRGSLALASKWKPCGAEYRVCSKESTQPTVSCCSPKASFRCMFPSMLSNTTNWPHSGHRAKMTDILLASLCTRHPQQPPALQLFSSSTPIHFSRAQCLKALATSRNILCRDHKAVFAQITGNRAPRKATLCAVVMQKSFYPSRSDVTLSIISSRLYFL